MRIENAGRDAALLRRLGEMPMPRQSAQQLQVTNFYHIGPRALPAIRQDNHIASQEQTLVFQSGIEQEVHHVAIFDDVSLTFRPHFSGLFGAQLSVA